MVKILISDSMSPRAKEIFENRGIDVDVKVGLSEQELVDCIGDYDGLAVRSATKVTAQVLAAAENLTVIGRAGIGVDNVDLGAATANGVVVMNTPFGNAITTAERTARLSDADRAATSKAVAAVLEAEGVAYDINAYRDAPPGLRIWAGATIEKANVAALTPWLDWAYATVKSQSQAVVQ